MMLYIGFRLAHCDVSQVKSGKPYIFIFKKKKRKNKVREIRNIKHVLGREIILMAFLWPLKN